MICLVVIVPLAGCDGGLQPWHLTVKGDLIESDSQYQFDGKVELSGNPTDVSVTGVRVTYLDENQTRLGSDFIGNMSGLALRNVSHTLSVEPKYIIVEVDDVHNPTGAEYYIEGSVVREEQGEYILRVGYTDYSPEF